jgi:hypothetical protein
MICPVRNSSADHTSDDLLEAYGRERLAEPDLVYLEEHLLICRDCRERLEAIDEFLETAQAGRGCERSIRRGRATPRRAAAYRHSTGTRRNSIA